ncbi:MAG: hypothetical protein K9H65_04885 [Bacteroidales bacterium]|nr:hypothetical protein [Bacteroidales bacterium]
MITVDKQDENTFQVTVEESGSRSSHNVTLDDKYHKKLTGGVISKEDLIKKSFEFLLEKEPKESIMSKFDLTVISKFFPEYESYISMQH